MATIDAELREAQIDFVKRTVEAGFAHLTALSEASGVSQSSFSRLMNTPDYTLSANSVWKIAQVSPVPLPAVLKKIIDRVSPPRQEREVNIRVSKVGIPVWGCHPVVRDGEFRLNPHAVQDLERPGFMSPAAKVVAFYAPDDTMAPRWMAGEIVVVDLSRSGTSGDFVLITLHATPDRPNETETNILRRLDRRANGHVWVSALHPDVPSASYPLDRIADVRRALSWNEVLR